MNRKTLSLCLFAMILLTACDSSRQMSEVNSDESSLIQDQFIVKLAEGVKPESLVAAFEKEELSLKKSIVPSMNLWLFTYNQKKLKPAKMLAKLKASELVKEAEFDKNLSPR